MKVADPENEVSFSLNFSVSPCTNEFNVRSALTDSSWSIVSQGECTGMLTLTVRQHLAEGETKKVGKLVNQNIKVCHIMKHKQSFAGKHTL